jgi:hypothetical protein
MKKPLLAICLLAYATCALASDRFGRTVISVKDPKEYQFTKLDDVEYPSLTSAHYMVSCLVYRGTENYYVEVTVKNNSTDPIHLPTGFITFTKPGYTIYRGDVMAAARKAALAGGMSFVPTPPPYVPPTYNTTINATATTYGNQTQVSGTATTTADNSGQAGANFGNALGNAIAAHRFYKMQRTEVAFSNFLASHMQTDADSPVLPGQSRTVVVVFDQAKPKKRPFDVGLKIGEDTFTFSYKE